MIEKDLADCTNLDIFDKDYDDSNYDNNDENNEKSS